MIPICKNCHQPMTPFPWEGTRKFCCRPCRREAARKAWHANKPTPTVQAPTQPLSWRHLLGLPHVFTQQQADDHYRARARQCEGVELGRLNDAYGQAKVDLDKRAVGWAA